METVGKIYGSLQQVAKEMSIRGIAKSERNSGQNFNFRGIDQAMIHLSPLFAEYHIIMMPEVLDRHIEVVTNANGKILLHVMLTVKYTFTSTEDGSTVVCSVAGEGMDSGDKATAKAMSGAYKYACFQALSIPVKGTPDSDNTDDEVDAGLQLTLVQRIGNCQTPGQLTSLWKGLTEQDQQENIEHFTARRAQIEGK
jgi:hypothetical protein